MEDGLDATFFIFYFRWFSLFSLLRVVLLGYRNKYYVLGSQILALSSLLAHTARKTQYISTKVRFFSSVCTNIYVFMLYVHIIIF